MDRASSAVSVEGAYKMRAVVDGNAVSCIRTYSEISEASRGPMDKDMESIIGRDDNIRQASDIVSFL